MAQASLSMRKIEEILRLKFEVGLTHREIAQQHYLQASCLSVVWGGMADNSVDKRG